MDGPVAWGVHISVSRGDAGPVAGVRAQGMSIRTIIKASNAAQLLLLLVLGLCLIAFGRGLHNSKNTLENYYHLELLLVEVEANARQSYDEAHAFILTGNPERYAKWFNLRQQKIGEAPQSPFSHVAAHRRASFDALAAELTLPESVSAQVWSLLTRGKHLDALLTTAVNIAVGNSGPPQWDRDGLDLKGAQRWATDAGIDGEAQRMMQAAQALREEQYRNFLNEVARQEAPLIHLVWGMIASLLALAASAVVNLCIFQKRVANPLGKVSQYAESVASGQDPEPLALRHEDELSIMFGSLERMKNTLFSRIRELKEAERLTRKSQQQAVQARAQALSSLGLAQKASHVQEDFLRRISHEIRTPLNAIIGMSYLCLQTGITPAQREYLSQINKSGSVLLDMVNRILDFSSACEGSLCLEQHAFSLPRLMELLRHGLEGGALEKHLELRFPLDPAVPATVLGDERHLEEALRILLDNAVRYTPSGMVECSVRPAQNVGDGSGIRLLFVVADSGPGMNAELTEKLFEPFAMGDESMTRESSGLGLGLALARQLVHLMGGELLVDSAPGAGSRFFFELSFGRVLQGEVTSGGPLPVLEAQAHAVRRENDDRQRTVLVVDDNEINSQIASELLAQAGLKACVASNGAEALDVVRDGGVDLVIMDVQMPVMDGLEATRRIREMGFTPEMLPILAMTAHADAASRMDGKKVGMNDYLTKPVDPAALYATLEKWLHVKLEAIPAPTDKPEPAEKAAPEGQGTDLSLDVVRGADVPFEKSEGQAVNVESGLATVGGNRALYRELLLRFVDHYGESARNLRGLLACGDLRGAARLAHTVKGVAANLGVERVCRLTRRMEYFLPTSSPDALLMDEFEKSMEEVQARVRCLEDESGMSTTGSLHLEGVIRENLLALLEELPTLLETDWGTAESSLEKFVSLADNTPYAGDITALLAAVKDFDNARVQGLAADLQQRLLREEA